MPILVPERSLSKTKTRNHKKPAPLRNEEPFDIKNATALSLKLPPVPQIIIDSPIDDEYQFCADCPYKTNDSNLLALHKICHIGRRAYRCSMCSFSAFNPNALHYHLELHAPDLSPNTTAALRKRIIANKRNGTTSEFIPMNAQNVITCPQCNFRTLHQHLFVQHKLEHVQVCCDRLMLPAFICLDPTTAIGQYH
jgi:DNA-directed RNA polymerase subunit RPC12/RpoP